MTGKNGVPAVMAFSHNKIYERFAGAKNGHKIKVTMLKRCSNM